MAKQATLYRMVMPSHICPFGIKAKWLLSRHGYRVDDRLLTSRAAQDSFKAEYDVKTTPQIFIDGVRIGGHDDLRRHLGLAVRDPNATSYRPVVAVFAVAALVAAAIGHLLGESLVTAMGAGRFVAVSMMLLAMLKLQDVDRFATMFLGYDLLAQRLPPYAHAYPLLELGAGALMLAGLWPALAVPMALTIGGIGAVSVVKAVYVDRRSLKCACVGGSGNVPLGFVSLTENMMMVAMAVWMLQP